MQQPSRISSGVPGLDRIVHGGLVAGYTYLLVGAAGTGKTVLSLQWLQDGVLRGERAAYITLAEPVSELRRNALSMGWTLDGIEFLDLSPGANEATARDYHVFSVSEVEEGPVWQRIVAHIEKQRPQRLVIDSLTQLRYLAAGEHQFRKHVNGLVNLLNSYGCTTYLAFEPSELERDAAVSLAVNGVIRLRFDVSPGLAVGLRSLQVEKLRGSDFMSGRHPMRVGASGACVYPHHVEMIGQATLPAQTVYQTGIPELDELLGGGLEAGTTTLFSGPAGTGKTTLGTHFLVHNSKHAPAVLFTFEEAPTLLIRRCRATNAPIDDAIDSGRLKVFRVNPLELFPDEFLESVRQAVEQDGCRFVMIDSLRGYENAMQEFGTPKAHIHNLLAYLSRMGVTAIIVSEVENITTQQLVATDLGVSHLADNVLLLRYAEHRARLIKVIGCLKKRGGAFQSELREMEMTASGLRVGNRLSHMRGLLTGIPETDRDAA